ncbi:uncharacterized protein LOC143793083 [Ranitomeya variabilis]|uniref:uncharacterized protein LOC143793083 n=1 Tax=Ranitomeya variabilis TaxID=490064 RepID=UPI0040569F3E
MPKMKGVLQVLASMSHLIGLHTSDIKFTLTAVISGERNINVCATEQDRSIMSSPRTPQTSSNRLMVTLAEQENEGSPITDSLKQKVIEVSGYSLSETEEMEQMAKELVAEP